MAKSVVPPKDDKITVTETKDVTGKELLATSPVGGPPDTSKEDASKSLSGVPLEVKADRGPEIDPKPFVPRGLTQDGSAPKDVLAGNSLRTNDANALGGTAALSPDVKEPTPFIQHLDLDGKWALRVAGVTVILEPKSDFAQMPVPGLLDRLCSAINRAVENGNKTESTLQDSPTIARLDHARQNELAVANEKLRREGTIA